MKKMPKVLVVLLAVWMVAYNCICFYFIKSFVDDFKEDKTMLDLPDYCDCDCYFDGVWRECIVYNKYYYHNIDTDILDKSQYLKKIDKDNIREVRKYVKDFEEYGGLWENSEVDLNYDFKYENIQIGDYFYVIDNADIDGGLYRRRYDCYDYYYFDLDVQTLYYVDKFV